MTKDRRSGCLFACEVTAITSFIWRGLILEPWSVAGKPLSLSLGALAGLLIVLFFGFSIILRATVSLLASKTPADRAGLRAAVILTLSPFLLLGLTFLQCVVHLNDLDPTLLAVAGLGFFYLQLVLLTSPRIARPETGPGVGAWVGSTPKEWDPKPLSRRLFLATALAYILYLSGLVAPPLPFTGDEPHYLLITESLLSDGDINLYNNYQNKDYLKFYPGELEPHAYPGKKGERYLYSKHQPAFSALLVPFYYLGEKLGRLASDVNGDAGQERKIIIFFSRLPVCLLAAFLSIAFFLYVWELTRKRSAAVLSWLVFSFTPPILFYSQALYPEILVALILLMISFQIIQKKNFSAGSLFAAGIGAGLLPWCGIKYVVPAATISLIVFFLFLRSPEKDFKRVFVFVGPMLLSAGLYLSLLFHLYGNLSPQTVYKGTAPAGSHPLSRFIVSDFLDFLVRLLGYLFDQRAGVFVIAPVYILFLPGLFFLSRTFKKETGLLAGLFSVFWAFCALNFFYWGGYSPPARPLVPVLWILALFMAGAFAGGGNRVSLAVRSVLSAGGLLIASVFVRNPSLLFQESLAGPGLTASLGTTSHLLARFSNVIINWRKLVPSLSVPHHENADWTPLLIWIPMILGITALFLFSKKSRAPESLLHSLSVHLGGVALLSVFIIVNTLFDIRLDNGLVLTGGELELFAQDENAYPMELDGFWIKGKSKATVIVKMAEPAASFTLTAYSPVEGKTTIRLAAENKRAERNERTGLEQSIMFSSPRGFSWKGNHLYRLEIKEDSGFYPSRINPGSRDSRFLGVFIRIEASLLRSHPE